MTLKQLCEKLGCDYINLSYQNKPAKFYHASLHYGERVFMSSGNTAVGAIKLAYRQAKSAGFNQKPTLRLVK